MTIVPHCTAVDKILSTKLAAFGISYMWDGGFGVEGISTEH